MPRYFVKITADHWTAKNNLHRDFQKHCYTIERVILDNESQKDEFINDLKNKAAALSEKHNRCKPLDFHTFRSDKTSEAVGVLGVSHVTLYKERE